MMDDPNANFAEVQKAFEMYFEGRERQPGDGWKVFKRWENQWKDQLDEDGTLKDMAAEAEKYEQWLIQYNQSKGDGIESATGNWEEIGPITQPQNGTGQPNGNGRLNAICFHPTNPDKFWVGAPAGGLWATVDGGATWTSNTDNLSSLGISAILINPNDTNVMYMGTGDRDAGDAPGRGVYKSTDGGNTWVQSNTGMGNREVGHMIMHPSNSSYILAATSGGIYRTQNAGATWTLESSSQFFKDIKFNPDNPNIVYATETSGQAGFYRSANAGNTWTLITSGLPATSQRYSIGVSEADPNVVYLVRSIGSAYGGLYKSTNAGVSFTTQSTTPNILSWGEFPPQTGGGGQGWYDLAIEVDPNDANIVYVGGVNIFKSTNSGVNWDCVAHWVGSATAAAVHADHHWFAYNPVDGRLYSANDGGLHYTTNGGNTWTELSSGLGIAQIYKIGMSKTTYAKVLNGYQDNGTALWDGNIFRTERGGDGMESVIDHTNDNIMYASVYYGNIARSTNNGNSFGGFAANGTNGITEQGAWVTPYILDNENSDIMFIGYKNVWRTTTATQGNVTFTAISNSLAGSNGWNMRQLRQSKVNGNRLFAIRSDNRFFRSDNALAASPTWLDLTSSLPASGALRDVETDPHNNNTIWISRGNDIWKSTNSGSTWSNISANLPDLSFNTIIADPNSYGGLYVAATSGIYYTDDSLANWVTYADSFPDNVPTRELDIYHASGNWENSKIRAATYGRGLWESELYSNTNYLPLAIADWDKDSTDLCESDTIQLWNNSAYGVDSTHWTITPMSGVTYVNGTSDTSRNPQIVIAEVGQYDVKLYVENTNGADSVETSNAIEVSGGLEFPWFDDFETNIGCGEWGCATTCDVDDWINVTNGIEDDVDWRVDFGGTPSSGTGPSVDMNPGTAQGNYLYIESSGCASQEALLESPCINLNNITAPEIKFGYHMFGWNAWFNDLHVDIRSNGTWTNLWTENGANLGDQWNLDSISLSSYIGENVKLRFRGMSGIGWQADMAIDNIALTAAPETDFTATDTFPCLGQMVGFTDLSTQNPNSWTWVITPNTVTYLNGTNSSSQNPQIRFDEEGVYQVMLISSNQYGGNTEVKQGYIEVIIPDPTLASNDPLNQFCLEDSAVFSISDTSFTNVNFFLNGVLDQFGSSIEYSPATGVNDGDEVYVVVTNQDGCSGSSDTITVTVFDSPASGLTSNAEDETICHGDEVEFSATNQGLTQYAFFINTDTMQNGPSFQCTTMELLDQDEVYSIFYDSNGCMGVTESIVMTVNDLPITSLTSSDEDNEICDGDTVTFMATNQSLVNYDFMISGSSAQSSSSFSYTAPNLTNGDAAWVRVTDDNDCEANSDTITTTVLPLPPTPAITAILDSLECTIPAELYGWEINDSATNVTTRRHQKVGDASYKVRIYQGGCWSAWSEPFIITGFNNLDNFKVKVYPSPTNDIVFIEVLDGYTGGGIDLKLIDLNGRLVFESNDIQFDNSARTQISLQSLADGVYNIILDTEQKNFAVPIVKESR